MSNLSHQPLSSIHFHPPSYMSTTKPAQAPPAPPPAAPLSPAQPRAVQAPAPSAPSVSVVVPQPPLHIFIPADAPPDASHSTPIMQTHNAGPSGARRFGHTSCVVPGFYWQLPSCMSSRHRSLNPVLRDVAAKRPHVEGFFSNASFRSHVRYIMDVMIVFARHCVLKPMRTPILRSSSYRTRISYLSF